MAKQLEYPTWVCNDCGGKHGYGISGIHCATDHMNTCDICGKYEAVTEPRDFGHLKETWKKDAVKRNKR